MSLVFSCLQERFENLAATAPHAPALTSGQTSLTYRELDERSNQLAHYLQATGVGHEDLVGLCLDRGIDMVIAILAVLKAGGAYVPMDPAYPAERVRLIVEDARCPVVLAHAAHAGRLEAAGGARVVLLDGMERPWEQCPDSRPDCAASGESLAYVIYTSGSTGTPKGVLITHRNVTRLFEQTEAWFGFNAGDVWTLFHSYAFDFSVWEIWGALSYGGRLVIVPHLVSRSPGAFYQLLMDEQVTVLNQTPSAFRQLQFHDETVPLTTARQVALRYVIFGGEMLDLPGLATWFDRHGDERPRLINMYGITETTVHVTYRPLAKADTRAGTPSFVGVPIPDLTLHVLDGDLRPVGVGASGEIYVGGGGVGRGYLNRPELTAERFVPDPFDATRPDARLYRTGDLARVWENDLEFLGRNDRQVQLRGFRVELGEIESALCTHRAVRAATVHLREDVPGDQRLAAYYLASEPVPVPVLREHLAAIVPSYMVPGAFVHLESFPLNNSGKIDTKALPAPSHTARASTPYVAPSSDEERLLVSIWEGLLRVPRIGTQDDFFLLGGHSLLLAQMLARVQGHFSVAVPLRRVMQSPTVECLAGLIVELRKSDAAERLESIPVSDRRTGAPLSFAQERLWIIDRIDPGNTAYNIPIFFEITGPLITGHLRAAAQAVISRHEVLRTVFRSDGGQPIQHVVAALEVPFEEFEVGAGQDSGSAREWSRATVTRVAQAPFVLDKGPLYRFMLFRRGANEAWLGLIVHHAIFDGWSISVLLNDLAASYTAQAEGGLAALPPIPRNYLDYTIWQRDRAAAGGFDEHLEYWTRQLEEPLPVLDILTDHPRPPRQTWAGAVAREYLEPDRTGALEAMAHDARTTLFTVLVAAWNLLLQRYTSQDEVIIGTAIAGRNHPDLEGMIGFFVNTVAIRTRLDASQRFPDFLDAVGSAIVDAQAHQAVPFEQVVSRVYHDRDPSRAPIFQVMFILHNTPAYEISFGGLHISGEEISNGAAKFDLTLSVQPYRGGLWLNLEYNTALFEPRTAQGMLVSYTTLLDSILAAPGAPLSSFEIVGPETRTLLLETWNDTAVPFDRNQSILSLFEAQAAAHPDCVAVADDETRMTYRELDAAANRIAHYLLSLGVTREEPVPFFLSRTVRVMTLIAGILKAGAAFVPLDLLDPPARRERVLSVLKSRFVLTESSLLSQMSGSSATLYCLDDESLLDGFPSHAPGIVPHGEDLAYVFFTSGSTGDPKGVSCTHQGVVNLYEDLQARYPVGPGDACSLWTAFSFDISVYESWTSLLAGATLHIIPERVRPDPVKCLVWLRERRVVTGYVPPFILPELLETQRRDPVPFRRLLVGLEPTSEALLCDIVAATPGLVLLNWYGPTEAAIYSSLFQVHDRHPRPPGNAPIGRPLQNTRMYVLDPARKLTPLGAPGELYIGGVGLARGYYNDPELTARQFVPDPFTTLDTGRLYRTGDLVFLKPDGNIQFIRRMGRFIKLRGFRIEPGEIESVMRAYPGIEDAVVVLHSSGHGDERLLAYVVAGPGIAANEAALIEYLRGQLPAHMRPVQFMYLDRLPRTVQGKLDRRALPEPPTLQSAVQTQAPRDAIEEAIARVWSEMLDCPNPSVGQSFFELGGHSLLGIRLIARLNDVFKSALTLGELYEQPTIEGLAKLLGSRAFDASAPGDSPSGENPLVCLKLGSRRPFFCVTGAGDVQGSYGPLAGALHPDQPFYGFSDHQVWWGHEGFPTVEEMAAVNLRQINAVQADGPYLLGGYSFGGVVAFEMARQLIEAGVEVANLVILDTSVYEEGAESIRGRLSAFPVYLNRIGVRLRMLAATWENQIGYIRDGLLEIRNALLKPGVRAEGDPSARDYLRWIWHDTTNQYFLVQGGLANPAIADRRLAMIGESWVRRSTQRVALSANARRNYVLRPIPVKITLLRVAFDPWKEARKDPTLGWGKLAEKGVDVKIVPGNHLVMIRPPFVSELGAILQQSLDRSQQ